MQLIQLALSWIALLRATTTAFCLAPRTPRAHESRRFADINNPNDYVDELRASAQKLREEVERLESALDRKPNDSLVTTTASSRTQASSASNVVSYTTLEDSIWSLKYRFTSDPPSDETTNQVSSSVSSPKQQKQPSSYSGSLTVKFRADGYTDFLGSESTGGGSGVEIVKVWGWDKENSNDNTDNSNDNQEYLLFSTTVQLPASDTTAPNTQLRFYWQGRIETSTTTNVLSVVDGTVTVKKDVVPAGFWGGVFRGSAGILAQFRQVGNFVAKPTTIVETG